MIQLIMSTELREKVNLFQSSNEQSNLLKKFLETEASFNIKTLCQNCRDITQSCKTCISQNGKYSEEERKAFQRMYNSMRLVNSDNPDLYKWQIEVSYPMRSPIAETFSPIE